MIGRDHLSRAKGLVESCITFEEKEWCRRAGSLEDVLREVLVALELLEKELEAEERAA